MLTPAIVVLWSNTLASCLRRELKGTHTHTHTHTHCKNNKCSLNGPSLNVATGVVSQAMMYAC